MANWYYTNTTTVSWLCVFIAVKNHKNVAYYNAANITQVYFLCLLLLRYKILAFLFRFQHCHIWSRQWTSYQSRAFAFLSIFLSMFSVKSHLAHTFLQKKCIKRAKPCTRTYFSIEKTKFIECIIGFVVVSHTPNSTFSKSALSPLFSFFCITITCQFSLLFFS